VLSNPVSYAFRMIDCFIAEAPGFPLPQTCLPNESSASVSTTSGRGASVTSPEMCSEATRAAEISAAGQTMRPVLAEVSITPALTLERAVPRPDMQRR
jgi:hypothetical protein